MNCPKWQGVIPDRIVASRQGDILNNYEGCMVAACKDCMLACVWNKDTWVARMAKDFTKRKITIGKLKDSLRASKTVEMVIMEDL